MIMIRTKQMHHIYLIQNAYYKVYLNSQLIIEVLHTHTHATPMHASTSTHTNTRSDAPRRTHKHLPIRTSAPIYN